MDTSAENSPREVEPSKNINLLSLDKNIAPLISSYLRDKDLVNLCSTSKGLYSIFYPSLEKRLMSHFLKYVVEGRLDKVEAILNRNKKLVFLYGDITDLSGRIFTRITAFQYAIWALDKEMWELILKYLPETDAYDQLMALEQERPDLTQVHAKRFNFAPLLDAYQKYIDNFDKWNRDQREACWCKEVGGAQRQMPAWFVYVFCEEREDKVCTHDFKKIFTRDPKHLSGWFDQEYFGGKLGCKWAAWGVDGVRGFSIGPYVGHFFWKIDRLYLNSCLAERTSCRDSLSDSLKRAVMTEKSSGMLCKIL